MAADVTLSMEMRNDTVIKSMRQVGAESDKLNRKAQQSGRASGYRGGMGILEASRAIEDAQYGMRGVLNNIPGIIMSFGGSMGLAGAVSIAAVAVSVLGKSIWDLAMGADTTKEDMEALKKRTEEYESAVKAATDRQAEFVKQLRASRAEAKAQAAIQETIRRLGDPVGQAGNAADRESRMRASRDRLEALRAERDALMGLAGTTPVTNPIEDLEKDAEAAAKLVTTLQKRQTEVERLLESGNRKLTPEQTAQKVADLEAAIAQGESQVKALEDASKKFDEQFKSQKTIARDIITYPFRLEPADPNDPTSELIEKDSDSFKAKIERERAEASLVVEKEKLSEMRKQLEVLQQQADDRKKTLDALQKEDEENKKALKDAWEKSEIAKQELETKRKELELQKEINQLKIGTTGMLGVPLIGDMMSMMNEVRMIRDEAALSQFKLNDLNPANMLSAAGRVGMAANEFNTAIATSNYQRESLNKLKEIARNTKGGKVSTYL